MPLELQGSAGARAVLCGFLPLLGVAGEILGEILGDEQPKGGPPRAAVGTADQAGRGEDGQQTAAGR